MTDRPSMIPSGFSRRIAYAADLSVFLLALVTLAVVINYFAHRPELRVRVDATRTRAYSLSPQTQDLLAELDGEWTIALIMVEDDSSAAVRSQVDEVLDRFAGASPAISVRTVDPTNPQTLGDYETLLGRLRALEHDRITAFETAIGDGLDAFDALQVFAQQQAGQLEIALGHVDEGDPARRELQQRLGLLALLAEEGGKVRETIDDALRVGETQPLPDYETARSILAQALVQWADELQVMATIYRGWMDERGGNALISAFAAGVVDEYEAEAQSLAIVADPLHRLPPLELASIGRELESGETAIIIGPDRSAVIPSAQLFPKLNLREVGDDAVVFDRRFRGEQVIASAIRSLRVDHMPMVVFVHASDQPILREQEGRGDLVGMASTLRVCRFDVREWSVVETQRPEPADGQPVVWVVMPPQARRGLEPEAAEKTLVRTAEALIAEGESVCLSVYPSLMPRYRQVDPWVALAAPFNLRPDTAVAVFEAVSAGGDATIYQPAQTVLDMPHPHPVAQAVHGQPTYLPLPVPAEVVDAQRTDVRHHVLLDILPDGRRWLEPDWATKMNSQEPATAGTPFDAAIPVVVAAERAAAPGRPHQRFLYVGSGGWMRSSIADVLLPVAGGRAALRYPGNQELLLASVAWLAEFDELIAPSPVSQQLARLDGVDRTAQVGWGIGTVVGLPLLCLMIGSGVWFVRRSTA